MNITERAALVLQEIDAALAMTANSRTLLPTSLRCLKTAVEGLLYLSEYSEQADECGCYKYAVEKLTTLCEQWEQMK